MRDFTNYEYQAIVDFLTEKYRNQPGLGDGYEGSMGQTLIQLQADSVDSLAYMLERRSQEAFLETARLESSIWARASELGYRPKRNVASTGTVEITLIDQAGGIVNALAPIVIPKYTPLFMEDASFIVTEDVTIPVGESTALLPVKEGSLVSNTYNFSVEPYLSSPTIAIENYMDIEEYSLEIKDADGLYRFVLDSESINKNITSLSYATENDRLYDIKFSKEGMRLVFGDGVFGYRPPGNVEVNWIQSEGEVTVLKTGVNFTFESDFITDTSTPLPANVYRYSMVNITPIRGANVHEDMIDIIRNAPLSARANNRAVTAADYEFWALRSGIGDVIDIQAYGEQETGSLIFNMNNVYLSYLTSDALELNIEQQIALREFLDKFKTITTHLVLRMADKIEIVVNVDFRRERSFPITDSQLFEIVKGFIEDYFELKRGSIGREVQHSEFVRYLQNRTYTFNGVKYNTTDFVKVNLEAQFPLSMPISVYDSLITLDVSYVPNEGDTWTILINDEPSTVTVEAGDSREIIVNKMREELFLNSNLLTAIEKPGEVIRVKSAFIDAVFTIDLSQGDLSSFTSTDTIYHIPTPTTDPFSLQNSVFPGSAYIVNENEDVLFRDNGNGLMVAEPGIGLGSFEIDYLNGYLISPTLSDGKYFIRWQQNEFQNFKANSRAAIVLSPIKESISASDLFSKIELV